MPRHFNWTPNVYKYCIHRVISSALTIEQQPDVNYVRMLSLVKADYFSLDGFTNEDMNLIINSIATG